MFTGVNKILFSSLLMLFLTGCASNTTQKPTGYLGNYDNFVDSKKFKFTKTYQSPEFNKKDLAKLTKIHLIPFELWLNNSSTSFNPAQLSGLSRDFHQLLRTELLKKGFQLVETPTADSLTIKGAFSNVSFSAPSLSASDFIPVRIVLNAGNSAYLKLTDKKDVITSVSIEAEFLQGMPQKRVFALLATKSRENALASDNSENSQSVKQILQVWAVNLAKNLHQLKAEQ